MEMMPEIVYGLFKYAVSSSNDRINQWQESGKDVEGNNHGLIQGTVPKCS
jgi:hypothetical protein